MSECETLGLVGIMLVLFAFNVAVLRVVGLPKWPLRSGRMRLTERVMCLCGRHDWGSWYNEVAITCGKEMKFPRQRMCRRMGCDYLDFAPSGDEDAALPPPARARRAREQ